MTPIRFSERLLWLLFPVLLTSLVFPVYEASASAVEILPVNLSSPHHVAGENGGSRLKAGDSIVICARDLTNAALTTDPPCRSIRNDTQDDIFVPWKTPVEWSAFLEAAGAGSSAGWLKGISVSVVGYVCAPQSNTSVCGGKIVIDQLGTRAAGYLEGDRLNYGAQDDVFGPVLAAATLDDGTINYSTTYVCDKGVWVQTKSSGSCGPLDGSCGDNTSILMSDNAYWPINRDSLCASGSILANLTQVFANDSSLYGWTWSCLGTPGRSAASCAARAVIASPGICGIAGGQTLSSPPTASDLCAYGTPSAQTFSAGATSWSWTCTGDSTVSIPTITCTAKNSNPATAGVCLNKARSYNTISAGPTAFCSTGTVSNLVLPDPANGKTKWTWTCLGVNGGDDTSCYAILNINGSCAGSYTGTYGIVKDFSAGPSAETDASKLCNAVGTMISSPDPSPGVSYDDSAQTWTWTCPGDVGGKTAVCHAYYIPNYSSPKCSAINNSYTKGYWDGMLFYLYENGAYGYPPFASVTDYCSVGSYTTSSFSYNSNLKKWQWRCDWPPTTAYTWCYVNPTNPPADGVCGSASGTVAVDYPDTAHLCSSPTTQPSYSVIDGKFVWTCEGTNGGKSVNCSVPGVAKVDGACGSTNGTYIPDAPDKNLCTLGSASSLVSSDGAGHGPWSWTCNGVGGGTSSSCIAYQCQACSGGYAASTAGTTSVSINHDGCLLSGKLNWTASSSILRMATMTVSGSVSGLGSFSNVAAVPNAPLTVCPPCSLTPGAGLSGSVVFAKAEGDSCSGADMALVGQALAAQNLTFQ